MKKSWMLMTLVFFVYAANVLADGAPTTRQLTTNVMVTNLDQYPDIVLLAYSSYKFYNGAYDTKAYVVTQNQTLGQSLIPSVRNLLAIKKDVLEAEGGVNAIDLAALKQKYTPAVVINPDYTYVSLSSPLASQTYLYKITSVIGDAVYLKLYQGIFTYTDGRNDQVVSY